MESPNKKSAKPGQVNRTRLQVLSSSSEEGFTRRQNYRSQSSDDYESELQT